MKFSVKEKPLAVSLPPSGQVTAEQISAAYEDLMCSYMELSDAQRSMDEVCQVMENIELSMQMLKSGSVNVIKLLNIDKSLEVLLGIAEDKITVELANEGLECAKLTAMEGFVDTIKVFIQKIIEFCKRFILKIKNLRSLSDNSEELIRSITDEQILSVMRTSNSHVATKTSSIVYNKGWLFYKVDSKSLYDLAKEETFKSCRGVLYRVKIVQNILWEISDFQNGLHANLSNVIAEQSEELDDIVSHIDDIVPTSILGGIRSKSDLQAIYDRSRELSEFGVKLITGAKSVMEDSRLKNAINARNESLRSIISLYARTVKLVTPIVGRTERTSKICGDFAREINKQSKQELK